MANVVKVGWFGKNVSVLMVNGKTLTGELAEVAENYIVLNVGAPPVEMEIMVHAIIAIRLAGEKEPQG